MVELPACGGKDVVSLLPSGKVLCIEVLEMMYDYMMMLQKVLAVCLDSSLMLSR
jgi:hypothetical protein